MAILLLSYTHDEGYTSSSLAQEYPNKVTTMTIYSKNPVKVFSNSKMLYFTLFGLFYLSS